MTALHADQRLLHSFLSEVADYSPSHKIGSLEICEQTYPGQPEPAEEESIRKGIPDAWITAGEDWCLVVENKVLATATTDQLVRHLEMARRLGFANPKALVLTVRAPQGEMPPGTQVVEWRRIYQWLIEHATERPWARRVAEYLEVMEARLVDQQQLQAGTLTAFNGFPFAGDIPYSYLEAKRVLGLAMEELRRRGDLVAELGMAPNLLGRPAITGKADDRVWDFLQIEAAREATSFTQYPHLTLGITRTEVSAMITVPNGVRRKSFRRLVALGSSGFRKLIRDTLERMAPAVAACEGMEPRFHAVQRRYPSQRSAPFNDAVLNFDLRTGFDDAGPPKTQPQWIEAVYGCLAEKRSNLQIQIGAWFPYRSCRAIGSVDALDRVAEAWIACRPLVDLLVKDD